MNLSSTSWVPQPDDSYAVQDVHYPLHSLTSSAHLHSSRSITNAALERLPYCGALSSFDSPHTTLRRAISLQGRGRLVQGRARSAILADLQSIRGEANALVLRRLLFRWGLYAVRRTALRQLQRQTAEMLWLRVGGRCFAWWRLVTERRLCREALYEEAVLREAAYLRDSLCRGMWHRWQQWARARARRRDRALRLSLVNRQRHAVQRWNAWAAYPRHCSVLRGLTQIRYAAERRLARFALVRWRLQVLENVLVLPLVAKAAQQRALAVFDAWQRRALVGARLRRLAQEATWNVGVRAFVKWKQWLRRRLQAALLQRVNESRCLLRFFSHWVWQHQLNAVKFANLSRR